MSQSKPPKARIQSPPHNDLKQHRTTQTGISPVKKWVLSGIILLHLLAVVAEPFRFFTRSRRGTSPAADPARNWLAPYIEFAYLNHGYFFFAPEPGPSHLMDCRLTMSDQQQVSLVFPDKRKQWPRLLYHRHFMLAEFLHQLHVPPFDAEFAGEDERFAREWQAERAVFERVRDSMSQHVAAKFGATTARIERLEHRLPSDDEVLRQRLPLDSPELYITLPDAPVLSQDSLPPGPFRFGIPVFPPGQGVLLNSSADQTGNASEKSASGLPPADTLQPQPPTQTVPAVEVQP